MTVDDSRIQKLRAEVLGQLDASRPAAETSGLEARVAALEAAVAALGGGTRLAPQRLSSGPAGSASHPSLQVLGPGAGEDVFYVRSREAALPFLPEEPPVDAAIVGIVDEVYTP